MALSDSISARFEALIRQDLAGRGVATHVANAAPLCHGELASAAASLARDARSVGIVTGFCLPPMAGGSAAAETDGPPGALYLARALLALEIDVQLVSDVYGTPLLRAGCNHWQIPPAAVVEFPLEDGSAESLPRVSNEPHYNLRTDTWIDNFFATSPGASLTHLVAIERPGPSHTRESLLAQSRAGPPPVEDFERRVPLAMRNKCYSMRGLPIGGYTAKTHRLFETIAQRRLPITTIGLADGGNEIGMGRVPWELLAAAIQRGPGDQIACRIATDHTVVAGVSNWAAYALALAIVDFRGRTQLAESWDARSQQRLIETLVRESGAVDGVTGLRTATVDGLPMATYLQILTALRQQLGLPA